LLVVLEFKDHGHPGQNIRRGKRGEEKFVRAPLQSLGGQVVIEVGRGQDNGNLPGERPAFELLQEMGLLRQGVRQDQQVRGLALGQGQKLFRGGDFNLIAAWGQDVAESLQGSGISAGNEDAG
jgi:hypothetical protein